MFSLPTKPKNSNLLDAHVGLGTMANYRAYEIGPDGHIQQGVDLECADDAEAIGAAGKLVGELAVELWQGTRMVAGWKRHRLARPDLHLPLGINAAWERLRRAVIGFSGVVSFSMMVTIGLRASIQAPRPMVLG